MAPYRHGRIIWARLRTTVAGQRARHPAIILDDDASIIAPEIFDPRGGGENLVYVIGVSTKYKRYDNPSFPLPHQPQGHAITRLKSDCAAIVGWYDAVTIPDDVEDFGGDVPRSLMARITHAVIQDAFTKLGKQLQTGELTRAGAQNIHRILAALISKDGA